MYKDEDDLFAREPFVVQFTFPSKGRNGRGVALLSGSGKEGLAGSTKGSVTGCESSGPWVLQSSPAWCWSRCTPLQRP